jgi:DTW domain-containing protein YfiP
MKPALCLCSVLRQRTIRTSVRVVVHEIELQKSTNTGRFLPTLLADAALVPYGARDSRVDPRAVAPPGTRPVVLFPVEGAPTIDTFIDGAASQRATNAPGGAFDDGAASQRATNAPGGAFDDGAASQRATNAPGGAFDDGAASQRGLPPLCLIVLDGTWHQARRLRMRFLQAQIPFARLPPDDDVSHYHLRQGHFEGSRSTLEAAARALAIIERDESIYLHLVNPLRQMVDRTLWLRGSLEPDAVYGGLPPGVSRHSINRAQPAADDVRTKSDQDEDHDGDVPGDEAR